MIQITVPASVSGKKLIRALSVLRPDLPLSALYKALRQKDVKVNQKRVHRDLSVKTGDEITLYGLETKSCSPAKTSTDKKRSAAVAMYTLILKTDALLVVSKKAGISVHEDRSSAGQNITLIQQLQLDLNEPGLTLCHRLDRQTSGLLLIGRHPEAASAVQSQLREGLVIKRYHALVRGRPTKGEPVIAHDGLLFMSCTAWLEKKAAQAQVYIHDKKQKGDKKITTRYRILADYAVPFDNEPVCLLEIELVSGRTHQIRAHMAWLGHPLLGDGKYGSNTYNRKFQLDTGKLRRQQLCAVSLHFLPSVHGPLASLAGQTLSVEDDFDLKPNQHIF